MSDNIFDQEHNEPVVMALHKDDPQLINSVKEARKTLSAFFSLYKQYSENIGVYFAVKVSIPDETETVHLWYTFSGCENNLVTAYHHAIPRNLKNFETISIPKEEIEDWMINDHGHLYGGYSIRLQRSKVPDNEKDKFDEFAGIKVYKNNDF